MKRFLILLLLLALWLIIDFTLGRMQHKKHLERKSYPIRESSITLFTSGPELFEDYFAQLKQAKSHIHVLFYILKNDAISIDFLSLLKEKAKEGLEVRLMLDWVGSFKSRRQIKKYLQNSGVALAFSKTPRFPFFFYSLQTRNHRKITVIDGKVGYLGGFNVGKEYINLDKKLSPWRDYHLKIQGEGVQDLQDVFLEDWQLAAKIRLQYREPYFPALEKGPYRHQFMPSDGVYLDQTFSKLIRQAKKSILIGTPYFIPGWVIADLQAALKRGVRLEILVPGMADHPLVKEASYPYFRTLIPLGATVLQYQKGFYHAKILMIDDQVCDIGTANFDKRSFYLNQEINCLIYDQNYIKDDVLKILKYDQSHAKQVKLNDIHSLGPWAVCKEYTARALSLFL